MKKILHIVIAMLPMLAISQTTVTYTQQTGSNFATFNAGTAGSFNNGSTEMGMYANTNGAKQTVAWRQFRTADNNGGSTRSLKVGDRFTITVAAKRAYGKIGVSLLASPSTYSSWNDRENNYAISANIDGPLHTGSGYGAWYIKYSGGATSATTYTGTQGTYYDYTFQFTVTAADRMNVAITTGNGGLTTTFYDVQLNNSNPITDYSVYLEDDYDGASNSNIFWKQTTSVTNTGAIALGSSNATYTISSALFNGLDANSNSVNSLNNTVTKSGTGTITLDGTNTYTGLTTVNAGTLRLNKTGGTTIPTGNNVTINSGGTMQISTDQSVGNLTVNSGATLTVDNGATLTITGTYTGGGTINNLGTINLNGVAAQTFPGAASTINNGTAGQLTNLTINNTSNVTLDKSFTVTGALTLTNGNLDVNGNTLTLNGTATRTSGALSANGTNSTVVFVGPAAIPASFFTSNTVKNLTINRSAGVSMSGDITVSGVYNATTGKLSMAGNTLALNGTVSNMNATNSFTGSNTSKLSIGSTTSVGTIYFDQTTSADVSTTDGTNALQNLVVSGSGGSVTIGNKLNLFNRLSVSAGTLNTGGLLVLRSISTNTAYVDQVAGTISGQVNVERYIHKQARGWRAITAPVTFNGIINSDNDKIINNWQNNFGYGSNYGTRISAPSAGGATGIDDATTGSSLQTYNSTTGAWTKITNTNTETQSGSSATAANKGFYLFVRGDRTVTPSGPNPNSFVTTTLATKGLLQTGTQTFNFTGAASKYWLIGNPYACPVDMSSVSFTNIGQFVYAWDPNAAGLNPNTNGNYTTFDRNTWGSPTFGTSTKYFQSGQAFFVLPSSTSANIEFSETNKSTSTNNNTQITGSQNNLIDVFNLKLYSIQTGGAATETDGIRAKFGSNFCTCVDADDAPKFMSSGIENLSLSRDGASLAIESRPHISTYDTLFLEMTGMSVGGNYQFISSPINFDASVAQCKIVDRFLNTETTLSLSTATTINFNITGVAGSNAADRFYIIFISSIALPTNGLNVKAYKKNGSVLVDWEAIAETDVKIYNLEKSIDGNVFTKLAETTAKNNNTTNNYSLIDNKPSSINYYRIKTININDKEKYSAIVKVDMNEKNIKGFSVYPNPIKGNTICIQLNNMEDGSYTAKLFNATGQQVYLNMLTYTSSNSKLLLQLNNTLSVGVYQLQLINSKGDNYQQTLIVAE